MQSIEGTLLDFRRLDLFASGNTAIHAVNARSKTVVTLVFIISVVSFNNHEISALLPFFIFPAVISAQANIPFSYILKKLVLALPFAIMIGIFNPLFDRNVLISFGDFGISGGWISCLSIIIRTMLTVSSSIILVSTTGFNSICKALTQMGVPRIFAMQLLFLYRYIFVLAEEVTSITNAYSLRAISGKRMGIKKFAPLLGNLILRTWDRAERIHLAMLSRGYNGEFRSNRTTEFRKTDLLFLFGWSLLFIIMRFYNVSELLGRLVTGMAT